MKKTLKLMIRPVFLGLPILEISKVAMYGFRYDYLKPKYNEKPKLCYMETEDIYVEIAKDVKKGFDT